MGNAPLQTRIPLIVNIKDADIHQAEHQKCNRRYDNKSFP